MMTDIEAPPSNNAIAHHQQPQQHAAMNHSKPETSSSCCCCGVHAILILNVCFFALYGVLWIGGYLINKGDADGWDQLGQALGLAILVVLSGIGIAIAAMVITGIQWKRLKMGYRILGFVPTLVLIVLFIVARNMADSTDDEESSMDCSDGNCKNFDSDGNFRL